MNKKSEKIKSILFELDICQGMENFRFHEFLVELREICKGELESHTGMDLGQLRILDYLNYVLDPVTHQTKTLTKQEIFLNLINIWNNYAFGFEYTSPIFPLKNNL